MATQPVEDIEGVLGRFQAWTGARGAAGSKAGVRELSDEEIVASGRYRWKPQRAGAAKSAVAAQQDSSVRDDADAPTREHGKAAAAKSPEPKSRAKKRKCQPAARVQAQAKPARKEEKPRPVFREVLAEAVTPAEVIVKSQPVELSRQVAISIRLAPAERALIKTRAAESGITASAYIRQCALEVEQLREQVRQAVAAMERGGQASAATSIVEPAQAKGFFSWVARKFMLRRAPALALRA